jgi:hypothetical protein
MCEATIDTSNLDLKNYQFFKYPTYRQQISLPPPNLLQKTKAVLSFTHRLLFGMPVLTQNQQWVFEPNVDEKKRKIFQKQFGYRGENLIALIGRGYPRKALIYYGAINKDFANF